MCKTDSKDGQDLVDHSMEKIMYYHNDYVGLLYIILTVTIRISLQQKGIF